MTTNEFGQRPTFSAWPRPPFILALGLVLGMLAARTIDPVALLLARGSPGGAPNFRLIREAWSTIDQSYVNRAALKGPEITYGAIGGMMGALGDTGHSTFLPPSMVKRLHEAQQGQLQGIGVEVQMKSGHVVVVAPLDGSPALRAGLKSGDVIVKVDGHDISGLPISQVASRITGPPGTPVALTVLDSHSGRTREATIVRASVKVPSVTWARLPGTSVAHLRIASFEETTARDLHQALSDILHEHLSAVILDLRNNPGGILDAAVNAASEFLKNGNVLLVKNARGQVKPVPVDKGGVALEIPLVVLINGGSASGAEILAGALKDAHRASLVGQTTFGTGTVLQEFTLSDGSALLLAVQEWLTPSGRSFWHKGIEPDIAVSLPPSSKTLAPKDERTMTADEVQDSGDTQLLRALELATRAKTGVARDAKQASPAGQSGPSGG